MTVSQAVPACTQTLLEPWLSDVRVSHGVNGTRPLSASRTKTYQLQRSGIRFLYTHYNSTTAPFPYTRLSNVTDLSYILLY